MKNLVYGIVSTAGTHPPPLSWKERGAFLSLLLVREGGWEDEFEGAHITYQSRRSEGNRPVLPALRQL